MDDLIPFIAKYQLDKLFARQAELELTDTELADELGTGVTSVRILRKIETQQAMIAPYLYDNIKLFIDKKIPSKVTAYDGIKAIK